MILTSLNYEVRRPPRWNTFLAGLVIDVVGLALLIVVGSRPTNTVNIQPVASAHYVPLIAPVFTPAAQRAPRPMPAPSRLAKLETPKLRAPRRAPLVADLKPPKIETPKSDFALTKMAAAVPPKPVEIKTNVFGASKSETATVHRPAREVQTGGFGDPNGVPVHNESKRDTVTVASVGSFELPSGSGKGNGTAGTHGVSGTVRASGFSGVGDTGTAGPHGRGNGVLVASSGFEPAQSSRSAAPIAPAKPALQPVEILYKPRPVYTAEARKKGVEGEVLLEVVFAASGSLRVNRVVKDLGYGLDDAAVTAAQHIRFHPARRDGQPYDCAALVHIVFELSD